MSKLNLNEQVIAGSNIDQPFQSVLKKRNPTLLGLHEVENLLWESF